MHLTQWNDWELDRRKCLITQALASRRQRYPLGCARRMAQGSRGVRIVALLGSGRLPGGEWPLLAEPYLCCQGVLVLCVQDRIMYRLEFYP